MLLHVRRRIFDVDAVRVMHAAGAVADRDDLAPLAREQLRRDRTDVAEPLNRDRRAAHRHAEVRERFLRDDHAATPRRLAASQRAAHFDGLPRHDGRHRVAHVHGVGIHDPRHHAFVRVHVRRGHVGIRTKRRNDPSGIATGQSLQLADAHFQRVTDNAALCAAEREIHDRTLPGHPRGERLHLVQGDVHVETDAALGGTAGRVVQHANPGIDLDLAVVEQNGYRDDDLLLGMPKDLVQPGFQVEQFSGSIEPRHHRFERILLVEKSVFVGADNAIGWQSKVSSHGIK